MLLSREDHSGTFKKLYTSFIYTATIRPELPSSAKFSTCKENHLCLIIQTLHFPKTSRFNSIPFLILHPIGSKLGIASLVTCRCKRDQQYSQPNSSGMENYNASDNIPSISSTGNFNTSDDIPSWKNPESVLSFYMSWVQKDTIQQNLNHIQKVWIRVKQKYHTYRCIQTMMFLTPRVNCLLSYQEILDMYRQKRSIKLLDVGCCFGQDIRKLIFDGIPPEMIYITDIHDGYWKEGLDLFRDNEPRDIQSTQNSHRSNFDVHKVKSFFGDLADHSEPLEDASLLLRRFELEYNLENPLENSFNFITAINVLHVLSSKQQRFLMHRIFSLLAPHGVLLGMTRGFITPKEWFLTPDEKARRYLHSSQSLANALYECGFKDVQTKTIEEPIKFPDTRMETIGILFRAVK